MPPSLSVEWQADDCIWWFRINIEDGTALLRIGNGVAYLQRTFPVHRTSPSSYSRLCICRSGCLSVCLSLSFWRSSILKFVFGTRLPAQLSHSLAPYEMANLFWRSCLNFFSPRNAQQVNTSDEESHLSVPLNVFGGWLISPWTTVELSYRCPSSTRLDWKG